MQKRKLGNSNLEVSALGLGYMGMSTCYRHADEKESIATLHHLFMAANSTFKRSLK